MQTGDGHMKLEIQLTASQVMSGTKQTAQIQMFALKSVLLMELTTQHGKELMVFILPEMMFNLVL
jgi:hypothetical protein